jgi:hypothetical protein
VSQMRVRLSVRQPNKQLTVRVPAHWLKWVREEHKRQCDARQHHLSFNAWFVQRMVCPDLKKKAALNLREHTYPTRPPKTKARQWSPEAGSSRLPGTEPRRRGMRLKAGRSFQRTRGEKWVVLKSLIRRARRYQEAPTLSLPPVSAAHRRRSLTAR